MAANKPNILILWGDDIGYWNISHYRQRHDGLSDAQHRPASPRKARRSPTGRPAKLHGRTCCFITGPEPDPHRLDQGRHAPAPPSALQKKTRRSLRC